MLGVSSPLQSSSPNKRVQKDPVAASLLLASPARTRMVVEFLSRTLKIIALVRIRHASKNDAATGSFCTPLLGELDCRGEETPSPELMLLI